MVRQARRVTATACADAESTADSPMKPAVLRNDSLPMERVESIVEKIDLDTPATEEALAVKDEVEVQEENLEKESAELEEMRKKNINEYDAAVEKQKFDRLKFLLDKTEIYSHFLSQKVSHPATENPTKEEPAASPSPSSKKRKGAAKEAPAKKVKEDLSELVPMEEQPELLTGGQLRRYQQKGLQWMISLYENGLNGILADEMGLGKTLQTIAFLSHLRQHGVWGPFLIVGPLSTVENWVNEFTRFTPSIPTLIYHGTPEEREQLRRTRMRKFNDTFPVVITSYEIIIRDRKHIQKLRWKYIVVDEGHRLKNLNCRLIRELKACPSANRLLLTGTPLQNNLSELWSLLNFLLPDIFENLEDFQSWFDFQEKIGDEKTESDIIKKEQENLIVSKLHQILQPFLLRRLKVEVEAKLPKKKEILLYTQLSKLQKKYYQAIVNKSMRELLQDEGASQASGGSQRLMNMFMQLRKCCNHPYLFNDPGQNNPGMFENAETLSKDSGKLQLLNRLLPKLKERGHRVLIFSQMTRMLDILQDYLAYKGYETCRLDGTVHWKDRIDQMKKFRSKESDVFCFLLSTRAGGLGINLTEADTVILFDSDWNPHQDMQAQDRAHRIGQTKPVLVYRLCTHNSVEERMLERANSKLKLEKLVIGKGHFQGAGQKDDRDHSQKLSELAEILKQEAADTKLGEGGVISDAELLKVMDRSDAAMASKSSSGGKFKVLEEAPKSKVQEVLQQVEC